VQYCSYKITRLYDTYVHFWQNHAGMHAGISIRLTITIIKMNMELTSHPEVSLSNLFSKQVSFVRSDTCEFPTKESTYSVLSNFPSTPSHRRDTLLHMKLSFNPQMVRSFQPQVSFVRRDTCEFPTKESTYLIALQIGLRMTGHSQISSVLFPNELSLDWLDNDGPQLPNQFNQHHLLTYRTAS